MQVTFKKVSVRHFRRVIFIFEMVPIKQKSNSLGIKKKRQNGCRIATMEIQTDSHGTWDLCVARGSQERLPESANLRSIYSVKWQVVNSTHSIGMSSLKAPSPDQSIFRESIWKVWHCWGRVVFKSLDFMERTHPRVKAGPCLQLKSKPLHPLWVKGSALCIVKTNALWIHLEHLPSPKGNYFSHWFLSQICDDKF